MSFKAQQLLLFQNAARIARALFEVALRKGWPVMAGRVLELCKVIERRQWAFESPLRQFSVLSPEIHRKLEARKMTLSKLREMDSREIGLMVSHVRMGGTIKACVDQLPTLDIEASIQPITRTVLRLRLTIRAAFRWNDKVRACDVTHYSLLLMFTLLSSAAGARHSIRSVLDLGGGSREQPHLPQRVLPHAQETRE